MEVILIKIFYLKNNHLNPMTTRETRGFIEMKIQTFPDLFGVIQTLLGALLGKRSGTGPRSGKVDPLGRADIGYI